MNDVYEKKIIVFKKKTEILVIAEKIKSLMIFCCKRKL